MAKDSISGLKDITETGDSVTESVFTDLIDSTYHDSETFDDISALQSYNSGSFPDKDYAILLNKNGSEYAVYEVDRNDSSSSDNGDTVIVDADGGRWKQKKSNYGFGPNGLFRNIKCNENAFENLRQPTLNVLRRTDKLPVWVDDNDIYEIKKKTLFKNGDKVGFPNSTVPRNNIFYKTTSGNLLMMWPTWELKISQDDGASWSTVYNFSADKEVLGVQSITTDEVTGDMYIVDYATPEPVNTIYKSTDEGLNWTEWKQVDDSQFRHWHGCMYDPISQTVFFMAGDGQDKAGIYKLNSAKDDIEPVFLNEDAPEYSQPARAIGLMFFDNYIVWASDSFDPAIYRFPRSEIGGAVNVEKIAEIANTGWWTQQAADDNSAWIACTASQEINRFNDDAAHLYYVTDEGLSVYNVGAEYTQSNVQRFGPVGSERKSGGTEFWISGTSGLEFAGKCSVTRTVTDLLGLTPKEESERKPISVTERVTWDGNEDPKTIFRYKIGSNNGGIMKVHEAGCESYGGGFMNIELYNTSTNTLLFDTVNNINYRQANNIPEGYLYQSESGNDWDAGDVIDIRLNPSSTSEGSGYMVVTMP